jgi:hypothetical protein
MQEPEIVREGPQLTVLTQGDKFAIALESHIKGCTFDLGDHDAMNTLLRPLHDAVEASSSRRDELDRRRQAESPVSAELQREFDEVLEDIRSLGRSIVLVRAAHEKVRVIPPPQDS